MSLMNWIRTSLIVITIFLGMILPVKLTLAQGQSPEFIVYGVFSSLNMGFPGEKTYKDFYLNMGARHGLVPGKKVKIYRRMATYNLVSKKLQKDVTFPIAELELIHVESNIAIGRLVTMGDKEKTPVISPYGIMVGDLVRSQ